MKTKRRTLIVLLVFVLAAGAALALLTHANQKAEQAASEAEDGSIPLLDGTTATLESVSIQYGGETLTLRPSDDGWTLTEDPAYHLDDSACNTIRTALAGMKARRQLEAQPGEDYGFDAPRLVVNVSARLLADASPDIAVVKGSPAAATRAAVELLGGMSAFVRPGQKVVIKPNMSFTADVASATNTHPEVVRELLVMCMEAGAGAVRILDHAFQSGTQPLERSGILDACNGVRNGVCHNLTHERYYQETTLNDARDMKTNAVMKDVLDADVLIAAPVAKTNTSTGVSLSLKGQTGLILDRNVMHWRYDLDTAIVDLCFRLKPALAVIDASRVLSTNGPYGPGKVLTPEEIIASADPVAADAMTVASYEWYGRRIQPRQVAHIAQAHARGLGRMDIENMHVRRLSL